MTQSPAQSTSPFTRTGHGLPTDQPFWVSAQEVSRLCRPRATLFFQPERSGRLESPPHRSSTADNAFPKEASNALHDRAARSSRPSAGTVGAKGTRAQGPRATDLERRKPKNSTRLSGVKSRRIADRQYCATSPQPPPRNTRPEPSSGPLGFLSGLTR